MKDSEKISEMLLKSKPAETGLSEDFDNKVMASLEKCSFSSENHPLEAYFWPAAAAIVILGFTAFYDGLTDSIFQGFFQSTLNLL